MGYEKKIICLANSRRNSGRCIAGREMLENGFGLWIRPVSNRPSHEISELDRRYEDGIGASALDIINISFLKPDPNNHQVENHIIDDKYHWEKVGEATWKTIESLVEPVSGPLWKNGESTYHGTNDKISESAIGELGSSLILVRPENFEIQVNSESQYLGGFKRHVRADFSLDGLSYHLQVTDPFIEKKYLSGENGSFPVESSIVCVSLTESVHGYIHKLAAAIFTPDMMT